MSELAHFRWFLHGNDEGPTLDASEHAYSVNWVMPQGDFNPPADSVSIGTQFWSELGQLIWPWETELVGWHAVDNNRLIIPLQPSAMSAALIDSSGIQARIREQIQTRCTGSTKPFDLPDDDDTPQGARPEPNRLPSEFAPLTHLPAGISGTVLGMTRTLRVPVAQQAGIQWLVPELKAQVGGELWSLRPQTVTGPAGSSIIDVEYAFTADAPVAGAPAVIPGFAFSIRTNRLEAPDIRIKAAQAQGGLLNQAAQTGAVAPSICPLGIFAQPSQPTGSVWDELLALWKVLPIIDTAQPASDSNNYLKLPLGACLQRMMGVGDLRRGVRCINNVPQSYVSNLWEQLSKQDLTGLTIDDIRGHQPVNVLAVLAATFADAKAPVLVESEGEQGRKAFETLKALHQALRPLLVAIKQLNPQGAEMLDTPNASAVILAIGQCMADAQAARFLFAAWLSMWAKDCFKVNDQAFFHWLCLKLLEQMSAPEAGQLMLFPLLQNIDSPNRVTSESQVTEIETWTASGTWEDLEALYATEALRLLSGAPQGYTPTPEAVLLFTKALQKARPPSKPTLPEDLDLAIRIEVETLAPDKVNKQLRGYAIALGAGYAGGASPVHRALGCDWITDVACRVKQGDGKWKIIGDEKKPSRFHETVGASREGGREVVSFNYEGVPICARLDEDLPVNGRSAEDDPDGVLALDFFWSRERRLESSSPGGSDWPPRLAYGVNYVAAVTPIGNAGKVLDEHCADAQDDRRLKVAQDVLEHYSPQPFPFLCRVVPGVPLLSLKNLADPGQCFRYSNETRAHLHLGLQGRSAPIALIRPKEPGGNALWKGGLDTVAFKIRGPDATPKVIDRWLQADWSALTANRKDKCDELSRAEVADKVLEQQKALLKPFAEQSGITERPRHPAVRAFGVEVQFFDAKGIQQTRSEHRLSPSVGVKDGYIGDADLIVKHGSTSSASVAGGKDLTITLAAGWFVQVKCSSLVLLDFCKGPLQRMDDVGDPQDWVESSPPNASKFRYYSTYEHWFECARNPDWSTAGSMFSNLLAQTRVGKVDNEIRAVVTPAAAPTQGIVSELLCGLYIQRHEWHWTGYPLAFARGALGDGTLEAWSGPFIGTESWRDDVTCRFTEEVNQQGDLCIALSKPQTLSGYRIAPEHGAKYAACLMRPVWRFEGWRVVGKSFIDQQLGRGGLIPARVRWEDPALRLPPPRVKVALPLTRTFEPDLRPGAVNWAATANGSVLVLEDVIYRTDPGARFGGVSETIEVELEATHVNGVYEIGANPIFHAGSKGGSLGSPTLLPYPSTYGLGTGTKGQDTTQPYRLQDWGIEASAPFGLTYDLDRNAKVAQTAIIVRPTGTDVFQYWVMAKVRLRRMLDPATQWTQPEALPIHSQSPNEFEWSIRRRPEGTHWVPHDWCLDLPIGNSFDQLTVAGRVLREQIAPAPQGDDQRLIGSWHMGMWSANAESLWGLQILLQSLQDGAWKTVRIHSPRETGIYLPTLECTSDTLVPITLVRQGAAALDPALRRVLLSDYSESHWLTFIGMPYRSLPFANESYWLELNPDTQRLKLSRTSAARSSGAGKQKEDISRDLMLTPVEANDFNGSAEERVQAEDNSFHLLLLFERIKDVAAPDGAIPLGALKAVYKPTRAKISGADPYPPIVFTPFMESVPAWSMSNASNLVGYIYRFHRAVGNDGAWPDIRHWADLVKHMFPDPNAQVEARVRWTPEFIGPIAVLKDSQWQDLDQDFIASRPIRINAEGVFQNAKVLVDPDCGWSLSSSAASAPTFFKDRTSGPCRLVQTEGRPVLELLAAGNCLLARLYDWAGGSKVTTATEGQVFDTNGKDWAATWKG